MRFFYLIAFLFVIPVSADNNSDPLELTDQKIVYLTGIEYRLTFNKVDSSLYKEEISIASNDKNILSGRISEYLQQDNSLQISVQFESSGTHT
ncbi:MAG TPA: hypothetical protein ENO27_00300, partial [Caldithrix sp.]|nr:hypothetical protein [Caldithrix sp.]